MFTKFLSGISTYTKALEITGRLNLWRYYLIPGLISVALAAIIGFGAWQLSDDIGGFLFGWYPENWWGYGLFQSVGSVLGGVALVALGLLLYKTLVVVLAGPFMGPLSEKVEMYLTGQSKKPPMKVSLMARSMVRGVRIALRNVIRELFYTMILLIFGLFVPFSSILIFLVQSFYAGFGNMDLTLDRHYGVKGSVAFVRRNRWSALGNGVVFVGLLLTGVGFLIAPPLATIAATIETVKRLEKYQVPA